MLLVVFFFSNLKMSNTFRDLKLKKRDKEIDKWIDIEREKKRKHSSIPIIRLISTSS